MTGLLFLGLLVLAIGGFIAAEKCSSFEGIAFAIGFVSSVAFVGVLILCVASQYNTRSFEAKYIAVKETIEVVRSSNNLNIERAALAHEMVTCNMLLAGIKYWNDGIWDWFYSDDVANLEYLK